MNKLNTFFHKIKKSLFYLTYRTKRFFRVIFKIDQKIYISDKKLLLPPGHLLSLYNYSHKEYDKFLPKIISNIKATESIIDIGANIGDTLFRLINSNSKPNFYCIEADEFFFKYLKKNKDFLDPYLQENIFLIKELVGDNLTGNLSKSSTGTKTLIESSSGNKTKKLDQIIKDHKIENIKLIKVDVDGYDYNVLFSAMNEISKNKPDLFFEYFILNETSQEGYIKLIKKLFDVGYSNWIILDNYGSIILETKNINDILKLIERSNKNKTVFDIYCKFY